MSVGASGERPFPTAIPGVPDELVPLLVRTAAPDRLALVGGAVRDLLLHRVHDDPWRGVPDLDLVVEPADTAPRELPPAHRLARRLRAELGEAGLPFCQEHAAYGTVELELTLAGGPLLLDLASARLEMYPDPGENPIVRAGRLRDDLARRDFTINAMALRLGSEGGVLVDPHGGRSDLEGRSLRFLHPGSVGDDPTRVLRGARYAARLGFDLAEESVRQLHETLARWPWGWRPGDPPTKAPPALATRLRMELELLLEREPWALALDALQRWGGLTLIDPSLQQDRRWLRRLRWASRLGLPLLPSLLCTTTTPLAVAERLQIPHGQHKLLVHFLNLQRCLAEHGSHARTAADWCALLEAPGAGADAVALALAAGVGPRRPLLRWWLRWRHLKGAQDAKALMRQEGLRPGPAVGTRLRQLREQRLAKERC